MVMIGRWKRRFLHSGACLLASLSFSLKCSSADSFFLGMCPLSMVHPVITTPLLLVSATLTGALLQYSWWTGTPALFALMAVAVWHSNHAMLSYQQLRIRHRYCILFVMISSGIASAISAYFFPIAVKTLTVIHLSMIITHDRLLHYDFVLSQREKCAKSLLAVFAPLSLLAMVSVGLVFNLSPWAAIPCCTLQLFSLHMADAGMRYTKIVKHPRVFSAAMFALLLALIVAFFYAYIIAPFFWPLAAAAAYHAYALLESNETKSYDMYGVNAAVVRVFSWLQPVIATCVGVAIALNLDVALIVVLLALLIVMAVVLVMAVKYEHVENFTKNQPIPAVNRPCLLIGALIVIFVVQIACTVGFHFTLGSHRYAVPFLFFAQALGYVSSVHIFHRLTHKLSEKWCAEISSSLLVLGCALLAVSAWFYAAEVGEWKAVANCSCIIVSWSLQFVSISDTLLRIQQSKNAAATAQVQPAAPAAAAAPPAVTYDSDYESGGSQLPSDDDDDDN